MTPRPAAAAEASRLGGGIETELDGEIETELGGEIETGIAESRVWGSAKARRAARAGPENVLK